MNKKRILNILKFVLFLGLGLFFVYWFLLKLDADTRASIWQSFRSANYFWVAVAMVVSVISHVLRALRWNLLLHSIGHGVRWNHSFGAVMVAYLANLAVPRLGEVLRCGVLLHSDGVPVQKSLGTVVTERIVDIFAFLLTLLLGLALAFYQLKDWLYDQLATKVSTLPSIWVVLAVGFVLAVAVVVLYVAFRKKLLKYSLFQKIDKLVTGFFEGLKSIAHLRRPWLFVFYSITIYFLYFLGGYIIFLALPETSSLPFVAALVLYIFGTVGMMVTPGGIGLYPVLVWQALAIYGVGQEAGLASGWLLWSSQQVVVLILGFAYLVKFSILKKQTAR